MVEPTAMTEDSGDDASHLGALIPSQILYLQQDTQRLYVELIQIIRDRNIGWLRPLCLCTPIMDKALKDAQASHHSLAIVSDVSSSAQFDKQVACDGVTFNLQDMRQSADLLWPLAQCHIVLDIEAIPILSALEPTPTAGQEMGDARRSLNHFMTKIWSEVSEQ